MTQCDHNVGVQSPIVAGYVLVRLTSAPPGMTSVPAQIITISDCIMDRLPRPDYWDWFQNIDDAIMARAVAPDATVVAVGLEPDDARELMEEMGGPQQPYFALLHNESPADGRLLGYELVGAEWTLDFHSWHCHGFADDLLAARGIGVNDLGLFDSLTDARIALDWMTSLPPDEAPAVVPWLIVALFVVSDPAPD